MTLIQAFIEGWNKGIRPFHASLRPLLTSFGILAATCLWAVLLDLAKWPTMAVAVIATGCVTGGCFLIYAWLTMFRAAGFIKSGNSRNALL